MSTERHHVTSMLCRGTMQELIDTVRGEGTCQSMCLDEALTLSSILEPRCICNTCSAAVVVITAPTFAREPIARVPSRIVAAVLVQIRALSTSSARNPGRPSLPHGGSGKLTPPRRGARRADLRQRIRRDLGRRWLRLACLGCLLERRANHRHNPRTASGTTGRLRPRPSALSLRPVRQRRLAKSMLRHAASPLLYVRTGRGESAGGAYSRLRACGRIPANWGPKPHRLLHSSKRAAPEGVRDRRGIWRLWGSAPSLGQGRALETAAFAAPARLALGTRARWNSPDRRRASPAPEP